MAEKKFPTGKIENALWARLPKKGEEPNPASQTQQAFPPNNTSAEVQQAEGQVKPQGINWNTVGLFSALVSLIGTGILFIMGWGYLSNWYSYFGISISQVDIQPQEVIIQSVPGLVTTFGCFVIAIYLYFIIKVMIQAIKLGFTVLLSKTPQLLLSQSKPQFLSFQAYDWMRIVALTEVFLLAMYILYYQSVNESIVGTTIYELFYMKFILAMGMIGALLSIPVVIIGSVSVIILSIILLIRKRFKIFRELPEPEYVFPRGAIFAILLVLITITALSLSSIYGINDASRGVRTGGWKVEKVMLLSTDGFGILNQNCDPLKCLSGPYGLVGQNSTTYYLVAWTDSEYYEKNPGLYYVPISKDVFLVPPKYGTDFGITP